MKTLSIFLISLLYWAEPTAYTQGALVTSTTTETGFTIKGSYRSSEPVFVIITLVSGSVQFGVANQNSTFAPVIDVGGTNATWSTAGDKVGITFSPRTEEIRMKGTATFSLNW